MAVGAESGGDPNKPPNIPRFPLPHFEARTRKRSYSAVRRLTPSRVDRASGGSYDCVMRVIEVPLAERGLELEALELRLAGARRGQGAAAIVEGSAGIGKSRLLAEARARSDGFRVVSARGSPLELAFPFGVVRQLFEPVLAVAHDEVRTGLLTGAAGLAEPVLTGSGESDTETEFAALHGLYWLVVNVAESSPLLIVVDDVQWADASSLRWLIYLARRLEGLPVALVAATRPPESVPEPRLLVELTTASGLEILRPGRLSDEAIAGVVEVELERQPEQAFVEACRRVTRGNPFLLRQLLGEVSRAAIAPVASSAKLVDELGSRDVARMVQARLSDLPAGCVSLARAVAVLGDEAPVGSAARLAGLTDGEALRLADHLAAVDILQRGSPLAFVHPLVRTSVYGELAAGELSTLHARAANLLSEEGAADERIALHLMACTPSADVERVGVLRRAAASASRRGALEVAVAYLRRALTEAPRGEFLPAVAFELGAAALRGGEVGIAVEQLTKAARTSLSAAGRAEAANALATALYIAERPADAVSELSAAIEGLAESDRERGLQLQAARWAAGRGSPSAWREATAGERLWYAVAAFRATREGTADEARRLALRAFGNGKLLTDPGPEQAGAWFVPFCLLWADGLDEAIRAFDSEIDWANRHGSLRVFSHASSRAYCSWSRGSLADAEADASDMRERLVFPGAVWAAATLASVLLERGKVAEAGEVIARSPNDLSTGWGVLSFLQARARVRFALQQPMDALEDLDACGRLEDEFEIRTPSNTSWRAEAALVLASLGRHDEAKTLAHEELERSRRYGALRPLGIALRALGVVSPGPEGLELLAEAVDVHARSQARLEHGRSLAELGAALRRAGRRREARDPLRTGIEIAFHCGADALAVRAHDELVAAGALPRRDPIESRSTLTAGEFRVARLASEGLTNRQIAQALFLTEKTIEVHLTRAYRKLEIRSRSQLARALPGAAIRA